jgi:2-dehydropantoate 2-reductase
MRIGFVGAGAIGANLGGPLTEAGHDVTLIDPWPEHVEAMRSKGLRLSGTVEDRTIPVNAMHLNDAQSITEPFEVVFVAVKSYDTEWATVFAARLMREPDGVIVSSQNGLNDPRVGKIVGEDRTLGCVVLIAAALEEPGHATRADAVSGVNNVRWKIGELDGSDSERAHRIAQAISAAGDSAVTTHLIGERWSKLTINCMVNGLCGLTGLRTGQIFSDGRTRPIAIALAAEAISAAGAVGHTVEPVVGLDPSMFVDGVAGDEGLYREVDHNVERVGLLLGETGGRASALQDVLKGRRTEIDYLNGEVVTAGARLGVPTPMNAAVVNEFERLGTGFTPDPARIEPLNALLPPVAGTLADVGA